MCFGSGTSIVDYAAHSIYVCPATYPLKSDHYEHIVCNCIDVGIPRSATVLDVGAALGGLMQKFKDYGFREVHGISVSPEEVDECQKHGLKVLLANVESQPTQEYDLVTLSHVLEHVPEPIPFLRALRRWVKPNGSLYVEVPDARYYDCYFTSVCQGFNNEHINHFDGEHLEAAMLRAGLWTTQHFGSYIADDGHLYPCVWVMPKRLDHTPMLREAIERYTDRLNVQLTQVTKRLEEQIGDYDGLLALWGAGQTSMLLAANVLDGYFIHSVTDTNPAYHGSLWDQRVEVVAPEKFNPPAHIPIVVCSQLSQKAIVEEIRRRGLTNRLITLKEESQ